MAPAVFLSALHTAFVATQSPAFSSQDPVSWPTSGDPWRQMTDQVGHGGTALIRWQAAPCSSPTVAPDLTLPKGPTPPSAPPPRASGLRGSSWRL